MTNKRLFEFDAAVRAEGYGVLCGVDEAGRGPLAGPVCAAAVILPPDYSTDGLDDSKKLTAKKRETLFCEITKNAVTYAVKFATVSEIDELNILNAALLAMSRAIAALGVAPDMCLIDGNRTDGINYPCRAVVGGDGKSAAVAAASVIAKVTRDRYMTGIAEKYPGYGFEKHKGYGTKEHRDAILSLGATAEHRTLFLRKITG